MTASEGQILVIDDDGSVVDYVVELLAAHGLTASGETVPATALQRIEDRPWDLVICDVEMPAMRGVDLLAAALQRRPGQLVLLMTAFGSIDLAVQALRAGACDFVTKPFPGELLVHRVKRALGEKSMRREIVRLQQQLEVPVDGELVAKSPAMRKAVDLAKRAARTAVAVLLTGESGSGKTQLARWMHAASQRRAGPFVALHCGSLPLALLEPELFGTRRGPAGGEDRAGVLGEGHGGTVLLDDVGDLPVELQPRLLQVLETGKVRPMGAHREFEVDVRMIATSRTDLAAELAAKRFREDLYYRLSVLRIAVPPLRERREDLPALVDHALRTAAARLGRHMLGITGSAMRMLLQQPWPGNVRELTTVVERAVALAEFDTLTLADVEAALELAEPGAPPQGRNSGLTTLAEVEYEHIRRVLEAVGGHKGMASRVLGIDRKTLYRKLEERQAADGAA